MSYLKDWRKIMNDLCILPKLSFEDINDIKSNFDIRFSKICDDFDDKNKSSNLKSALNSLLIYFIEPYVQIQNINQKNYKSKSLCILVNNRKSLEFILKEINNQCLFLRDNNQDYNKYMEIIQSSFFALDLILEGVTGDDKYYYYNPYSKLIEAWLKAFLKLQKFVFLDFTKSQDINIFYNQNHTKPNIEKKILEEKVNSDEIIDFRSSRVCINSIDLRVLALLYVYNGESINEDNKDSIAVKYGFQNGNKLKQHYNFYSNVVDRTANADTKLKLKNKIKLFKKVELILNEEKRDRIRGEITTLEHLYHNW